MTNNSNIKSFPAEYDIEEYYDLERGYYDATKMVIQLTSPMKFEEIKQQILDNQEIVQRLRETLPTMERIIYSLDHDSMKEEVELLKHIKLILEKQA